MAGHQDQLLVFPKSCPAGLRVDLSAIAEDPIFHDASFGERFQRAASAGRFRDQYLPEEWRDFLGLSPGVGPGVRLHFKAGCEPMEFTHFNRRSQGPEQEFLDAVVLKEYLESGVTFEYPAGQRAKIELHLFVVPKDQGSTFRVILDASYFNPLLEHIVLKYETLWRFLMGVEEDSWLWHIDQRAAFFQLLVEHGHRTFFGFNFTDAEGQTRHFGFNSLVMGCASSPALFQYWFRALLRDWLEENPDVNVLNFLDDLTGNCKVRDRANESAASLAVYLVERGASLQVKKCVLEACQRLVTLGFLIRTDLPVATLFVAPARVAKILALILVLWRLEIVSGREAAELGGMIMSCRIVLGDLTALRLRAVYAHALEAMILEDWDAAWAPSISFYRDLAFWAELLDLNKAPIGVPIHALQGNEAS
jgi:hypothetical protein